MVMPLRTKGYMLLELLVVMFIMTMAMSLFIYRFDKPDFNDYIFMSEYLKLKSEAMAYDKEMIYNDDLVDNDYPIIIDANGTINQAQTIYSNKHKIIINLGTGYLVYEE